MYSLLFSPAFQHCPYQEYIRRQLEEEQRQLEILQQQLLQEQALLLVIKICVLFSSMSSSPSVLA